MLTLPSKVTLCVRSCQLGFSTLKERRNVDLSLPLSSAGKQSKAVSSRGLMPILKSASADITVRTRDACPASLNETWAAFVCAINCYDGHANAQPYALAWSVWEPVCLKHRVWTGTECELSSPQPSALGSSQAPQTPEHTKACHRKCVLLRAPGFVAVCMANPEDKTPLVTTCWLITQDRLGDAVTRNNLVISIMYQNKASRSGFMSTAC